MRLVLHLAGTQPDLAQAEAEAVLRAHGHAPVAERFGRLLFVDVADGVDPRPAVGRLALAHEASLHLFSCAATTEALAGAAAEQRLPGEGAFAVRADRPEGEPAAARSGMRRGDAERTLGEVWRRDAPVDLDHPRRIARAWITGGHVHVGLHLWTRDTAAFEGRASRHRPFFSPVSGHPNLMRAIVNLAATTPESTIYDPLCGTGGIVLEAALAGHRAFGSDLDPGMVQGAAQNLAHFDARAEKMFVADVRDAAERFLLHAGLPHVDALVADLPYGQSASTGGATTIDVASWTLACAAALVRLGGRAVIGVADLQWVARPPSGLRPVAHYPVRIHKSLTRSYVLFQRI